MLIGICGGIGSGKSVVSRILRLKGFKVYDCDAEAKRIMEEDRSIKLRIRDEISSTVTDGTTSIDRAELGRIVFNDENARLRLNGIVHGAVREDVGNKALNADVLWVEAAVLAESGLAGMCDRIWLVKTPYGIRIENILRRDKCSSGQAESRIRSQQREEDMIRLYADKTDVIPNDGDTSLLAALDRLLADLSETEESI